MQTKTAFLIWFGFVIGGSLLASISGRLTPHFVSDSPSYLHYSFASLKEMSESIRTPGYPLWLVLFKKSVGIDWVPLGQVIIHSTAAAWFTIELARLKMTLVQACASGMAIGVGCTAMDNISTISTDALAASVGVGVAACLLRLSHTESEFEWGLVVIGLCFGAIMLRPAYLFLIPWVGTAGVLLQKVMGCSVWKSVWTSGLWSLGTLSLVLAWMGMRYAVSSDFAILPFGHQNLGGVLVQLVSDDELTSLPGEAGQLGRQVVLTKDSLDKSGFELAEGVEGATMTIDDRWDAMTYYVVVPAASKLASDDVIAQHHLIAKMNAEIIRAYPRRYAAWVLKNGRRCAWAITADMTMHPLFLAAILGMMGWMIACSVMDVPWRNPFEQALAMRGLTIISLSYLIAKLGFVILTSPGIGRFSDAAAIFLPAWIAVIGLRLIHPSDQGSCQKSEAVSTL